MISDQAKQGLNRIFTRAASTCLTLDAGDRIEIQLLPGKIAEPPGQLLILTIANFSFKLLTIFHIEDNPATQTYFHKPEAGLGFAEVFPEVGNLCCGAMNRELGGYFRHLGMSTPYPLDRQCLAFIDVLKPAHLAQHRIAINEAVVLHATLCLCAYAPVDFRYVANEPTTETGALELF